VHGSRRGGWRVAEGAAAESAGGVGAAAAEARRGGRAAAEGRARLLRGVAGEGRGGRGRGVEGIGDVEGSGDACGVVREWERKQLPLLCTRSLPSVHNLALDNFFKILKCTLPSTIDPALGKVFFAECPYVDTRRVSS
jgi:hypothetical protein